MNSSPPNEYDDGGNYGDEKDECSEGAERDDCADVEPSADRVASLAVHRLRHVDARRLLCADIVAAAEDLNMYVHRQSYYTVFTLL